MILSNIAQTQKKKTPLTNTNTFTLASDASTSAGVFNSAGVLVRTLWSGQQQTAGTYAVPYWDGKDDAGSNVSDANYNIKVVASNLTYEWGVIGNSSTQNTGSTVWTGFQFMQAMCFTSSFGYVGVHYNEQHSGFAKFAISDQQARIKMIPFVGNGVYDGFVCTDGTRVYSAADSQSGNFVYAYTCSTDAFYTFSSGTSFTPSFSSTTYSAIDLQTADLTKRIWGIAVQTTGNYLFVGHDDNLKVYNKVTGALVQTITLSTIKEISLQGESVLWMIRNNVVEKYPINSDGTLGTLITTLTGLVNPMAIAVSPDAATIAICDGGSIAQINAGTSSQQVKAYSTSAYTLSWTLGSAEGYKNSPTVSNTKFYFTDRTGATETSINPLRCFIAFQTDGTFWVGDAGNYRAQHYAANRTFIDRIEYQQHSYNVSGDTNNGATVFNEYLEFSVDYSLSLSPTNGSWALLNNWRASITSAYYQEYLAGFLRNIVTLSNGRRYSFIQRLTDHKNEIVELTSTGIRFTGIFGEVFRNEYLDKDGNMIYYSYNGGTQVASWYLINRNGFDGSNNPTYDAAVLLNSVTATATDPVADANTAGQITTSGKIVTFRQGKETGYHVGAVKNNQWAFKTSQSTTLGPTTDGGSTYPYMYIGEFPADGTYDIGNNINYGGSDVHVLGNIIIWGYNGENWKGGQTNKYNIYNDDGLFLGQFGVVGTDVSQFSNDSPAMMAGNATAGYLTQSGGNYYYYHNDESFHAATHRWKITGLDSLANFTLPVTKPGLAPFVPDGFTDLMAGLTRYVSLVNNTNGWTRTPTTDDTTSRFSIWSTVKTGLKSYDTADIFVQFRKPNTTSIVARDLGTINSTTWILKGKVSYDEYEIPNNTNGGIYLEVLDNSANIIVRIKILLSGTTVTMYANSVVVHSEAQSGFVFTYAKMEDFIITKDSFKYANYSTVSFSPLDGGATINQPKSFRLYAFNINSVDNYDRSAAIRDLKIKP